MAGQVFATKANLMATRKSLDLSSLGFDLLDRKRNVLIRELMQRVDEAKAIKDEVSATFRQAYFALQQANMSLGKIDHLVGSVPVDDSLQMTSRSVMGVEIPHLTYEDAAPRPVYGFELSNSKFDDAYRKFQKVKELSVRLAEVENSVYRLAGAIRKTQKRANALEHIIIPDLKATEKAITEALEEKDREEFSRLKVIKAQKEKAAQAADAQSA
ncbi:V-type ATP synthase subunit D [Bittarella massiliensis (ex Durand et al. 2017)]|uniref:V-type ATP synthase subunit D n=1 Tax=Bittarella massiliensis (ex Durand et al. 2017) TaxID=1720313 RepID=UPI001AA11866|nr:V-type ATP synthase subunit D [Bittarella massiliensis (ex Durand et al. 2017)]MBO1679982.1 V-type ATP synthase subunit D [Bittarella massiliensis (ex Durand et al. 2017)]